MAGWHSFPMVTVAELAFRLAVVPAHSAGLFHEDRTPLDEGRSQQAALVGMRELGREVADEIVAPLQRPLQIFGRLGERLGAGPRRRAPEGQTGRREGEPNRTDPVTHTAFASRLTSSREPVRPIPSSLQRSWKSTKPVGV